MKEEDKEEGIEGIEGRKKGGKYQIKGIKRGKLNERRGE